MKINFRKLNRILNCVIGFFIGFFIGRCIVIFWNLKMHPDLYASYSAPWYTSIIVYSIFTTIGIVICIFFKIILNCIQICQNRKLEKKNNE